jgi:hypothetical protein
MPLTKLPGFLLTRLLPGLACLLFSAWAAGALYFDFPASSLRAVAALLFVVAVVALAIRFRRSPLLSYGLIAGLCGAVLAWWLTLRPSQDRAWQDDVSRTPYAEINGDIVTIHHVRNTDYRSPTDYTVKWESRTYDLRNVTGLSVSVTYWGSPYMAHPIPCFEFSDAPPLAISIETRKEKGESYSALGGLYRQFELIYVAADERDLIRLRTNFRKGEDVYLYHTKASPATARARLMEYLNAMNRLHAAPRWYNAVTDNCTTSIRAQHPAEQRTPWDWRILVNGLGDQMSYERGVFDTSLPFAELKRRSHINADAMAAGDAPDFSARIRLGRPGFPAPPLPAAAP